MQDKSKSAAVAVEPAEDRRNIHQRLHAVMLEVDYVQKDRTIGSYKVVTHDAVTAKVRPFLVKHGVIYYPQNMVHAQDGNRTEVHLDLVFANVNDPKDFVAVPTFGYGIDQQDKGPGKAVSYAVKMALLKALGLETGEDADDDNTEQHKPNGKPAKTSSPEPQVKSAPGVSDAKTWAREHLRELNGVEDGAQLLELMRAAKARWIKICGVYPSIWTGPDGSGLRGEGVKLATMYQCRADFDVFVKEIETLAADLQQPQQAAE